MYYISVEPAFPSVTSTQKKNFFVYLIIYISTTYYIVLAPTPPLEVLVERVISELARRRAFKTMKLFLLE